MRERSRLRRPARAGLHALRDEDAAVRTDEQRLIGRGRVLAAQYSVINLISRGRRAVQDIEDVRAAEAVHLPPRAREVISIHRRGDAELGDAVITWVAAKAV